MTGKEQAIAARQFLKQLNVGVLSTISVDVDGYPFGSMTPYTVSNDGEPIILISTLAQHTKNINKNSKVSLTIFDPHAADVQASGRLTWIGDAAPVDESDNDARARYQRYFPESAGYFQMHDFNLYKISLKRARFIGGFGQIFWVEKGDMTLANPLRDIEAGIIEHMNEDHSAAMKDYCEKLKGITAADIKMIGIDSEGFDLHADKRQLRFEFENPVTTAEEARAVLVKLARQARA